MTIIKFPSPKQPKSEFYDEIEENGIHVFSLKNAKIPGYYPNKSPDYPGVSISDLKVGDNITISVFFKIGTGSNILFLFLNGYAQLSRKPVRSLDSVHV